MVHSGGETPGVTARAGDHATVRRVLSENGRKLYTLSEFKEGKPGEPGEQRKRNTLQMNNSACARSHRETRVYGQVLERLEGARRGNYYENPKRGADEVTRSGGGGVDGRDLDKDVSRN